MGNHGPLRVPRLPKTLFSLTAAGNSGVQLVEAAGFSDWNFQLTGTFTGFTVTLYGTLDPAVRTDLAGASATYPLPGAAGGAWFALPARAVESTGDTNVFNNPLTAITQGFRYQGPLVAVIAVATVATPTGTCNCLGWAVD